MRSSLPSLLNRIFAPLPSVGLQKMNRFRRIELQRWCFRAHMVTVGSQGNLALVQSSCGNSRDFWRVETSPCKVHFLYLRSPQQDSKKARIWKTRCVDLKTFFFFFATRISFNFVSQDLLSQPYAAFIKCHSSERAEEGPSWLRHGSRL